MPRLIELGVRSFKIEGRLKGPEYVAATTRCTERPWIKPWAARQRRTFRPRKQRAIQSYSRGSGPGFLSGVNHQALVEGRSCDHRGLEVGQALGREQRAGRSWLLVEAKRAHRAR